MRPGDLIRDASGLEARLSSTKALQKKLHYLISILRTPKVRLQMPASLSATIGLRAFSTFHLLVAKTALAPWRPSHVVPLEYQLIRKNSKEAEEPSSCLAAGY